MNWKWCISLSLIRPLFWNTHFEMAINVWSFNLKEHKPNEYLYWLSQKVVIGSETWFKVCTISCYSIFHPVKLRFRIIEFPSQETVASGICSVMTALNTFNFLKTCEKSFTYFWDFLSFSSKLRQRSTLPYFKLLWNGTILSKRTFDFW